MVFLWTLQSQVISSFSLRRHTHKLSAELLRDISRHMIGWILHNVWGFFNWPSGHMMLHFPHGRRKLLSLDLWQWVPLNMMLNKTNWLLCMSDKPPLGWSLDMESRPSAISLKGCIHDTKSSLTDPPLTGTKSLHCLRSLKAEYLVYSSKSHSHNQLIPCAIWCQRTHVKFVWIYRMSFLLDRSSRFHISCLKHRWSSNRIISTHAENPVKAVGIPPDCFC